MIWPVLQSSQKMQVLLDDTYASSDMQRSSVIPSAVAYYERAYDLASPSKFPENVNEKQIDQKSQSIDVY
jgi:hypothetical protein